MDMGRRCFHFALFGLTRTIMTARCVFGGCESPKRFWRGSVLSMPTALSEGCMYACPAGRERWAPERDWRRYGDESGRGLRPFRKRYECNRACAEFVRGAFRRSMAAAEILDRTR